MNAKRRLTAKQRKFINEYVKTGNATQAAIAAGYAPKTAGAIANENLKKPYIVSEIEKRLRRIQDESIADATEILQYLTRVIRGEAESEEIVVEGSGLGLSEARIMRKGPSEADKLKAAKMLARRFNLEVSKVEEQARADRLELENEKLRLEIERLRGVDEAEIDDGFLEALGSTAAEDWNAETE